MSEKIPEKMSKEDTAYFIKSLWTALLKPDWERSDLIDLGMAVFTKTPLSKLDPKKFGKLFPYLTAVAEELGALVNNHLMAKIGEIVKATQAVEQANPATSPQPPSPTPRLEPAPPPPPPTPDVISITARLPTTAEPKKEDSDD